MPNDIRIRLPAPVVLLLA